MIWANFLYFYIWVQMWLFNEFDRLKKTLGLAKMNRSSEIEPRLALRSLTVSEEKLRGIYWLSRDTFSSQPNSSRGNTYDLG